MYSTRKVILALIHVSKDFIRVLTNPVYLVTMAVMTAILVTVVCHVKKDSFLMRITENAYLVTVLVEYAYQ